MNTHPIILLHQCWAKTDDLNRPALTVRDHCLIVGMVALAIWERFSEAQKAIFPVGAVLLAALHDIGKLTPGFQLKTLHWGLMPGATAIDFYETNHAKVSQAFLATFPGALLNGRAANWVLPVGGHHGTYPCPKVLVGTIREGGQTWPQALREELFAELQSIFGAMPESNLPKGASLHWLTGFITFADWIGSDTNVFPLGPPGQLKDRAIPSVIREIADRAISDLGWDMARKVPPRTFGELFPDKQPRAFQEAFVRAMDSPGLYIVEAPMGMGKTEAALAGCQRRWEEGDERGLYFALPTQLTSNRIHDRVEAFLKNAISDPGVLSLVHGNAWMNDDRTRAIIPTTEREDGASDAHLWYASGRKALLAPFGTGTIDQALMSCLPVKHSGLRLFALSGKVVILDEVHSYDPYTSAIVDKCVKWLLEVGCTVIVLSATLSLARREALVHAAGAEEPYPSKAYPLITKVAKNNPTADMIEIPSAKLSSTTVTTKIIRGDFEPAWEEAAAAAESGACVLIIRNTVALAQETYKSLTTRCRDCGIDFGLLHSRFPQYQREEKEIEWMEKLGSDSSNRPAGCILVSSQIVEQSVDIDADFLITDLAPVDLILQRLGRLHRHPRSRPFGFEDPRCLILTGDADWDTDEKTVKAALGPSAFIYPPFSFYQAERVLSGLANGKITLPEDIRDLIEKSALPPEDLPSGAREALQTMEAKTVQMTGTANQYDVFRVAPTSDAENSGKQPKTRWSETPTGYLILLKSEPSGHLDFINGERLPLRPSIPFDFPLAKALHRNAVRIPLYLVRGLLDHQPHWLGDHIENAVIAVVRHGSSTCELYPSNHPNSYQIEYHPNFGVSYVKNSSTEAHPQEDPSDDYWF